MYWFDNLEAKEFTGARAYFTDIDHRIISKTQTEQDYKYELERKLKTLLLTKNTVSVGATHLATEFAYNFFKENPILLNEGLIIPALRRDKNDFSELFSNKDISKERQNELVEFYHDNVKQVVRWDLDKNSSWFKDTLLKDLSNDGSVLRSNLNIDLKKIKEICANIRLEKNISREKIESFIHKLSQKEKIVFRNYRDLLYSISGARIVNCESALPQENYLSYSLADIETRKIILNETQIFKKLFLELAFESIKSKPLSIEILDYLSYQDIMDLRTVFDDSNFKEKYNSLITKAIGLIEKNETDLLFNFDELLKIREDLHKNFKKHIDTEIDFFFKKLNSKKKLSNSIKYGKGTFSIGIGVAGIFNPVASIIGVAMDSPAYMMNSVRFLSNTEDVENESEYIKGKQKILNTIIERNDFKDKTIFTDTVSEITNYVFNDLIIK
jgi:hypothetical protein